MTKFLDPNTFDAGFQQVYIDKYIKCIVIATTKSVCKLKISNLNLSYKTNSHSIIVGPSKTVPKPLRLKLCTVYIT